MTAKKTVYTHTHTHTHTHTEQDMLNNRCDQNLTINLTIKSVQKENITYFKNG